MPKTRPRPATPPAGRFACLPALLGFLACLGVPELCRADDIVQQPVGDAQVPPADEDWAFHGQSTFVPQYHPGFSAAYSGPQSLDAHEQARETFDLTLFGGVRPWSGAELWVNPEVDQGFGLSKTLGIAGFSSGEAFKLGESDPYPRLQRVILRQTIDLGGETQAVDADINQLAGSQTANRVVITAGKFTLTDIFDHNPYADDPKHTFLNWSIFDAGSWDYAADAWGYTYGAVIEWYQDWWTLRSGLVNLSEQPNSKALDTRLFDQYQYDEEIEERHNLFGQDGAVRLLGFLSHGRMGKYNEATEIALATDQAADIAAVRSMHDRGGFSFSANQTLTDDLGVFARAGWSQGQYEDFDYTDIDRSVSGGLSLTGKRWDRPDDTVGFATAMNEPSSAAKRFFAAGGLGILVGDGQLLHSGPEGIIETYYKFAVFSWANVTLDYQFVNNPAYNRDRGPVSILGMRFHAEF
jgi:high affinity Mn2+ porin